MAVERIETLNIEQRGFVTALIGNLADSFIDVDLKSYNFKHQLYMYLKDNRFKTIMFYDRYDGLFTYEEASFQNFLGQDVDPEKNKQPVDNLDGRPINGRFKKKTEDTQADSDKLYKWRPELGFYQIKGTSDTDTALLSKFQKIIRQTSVKTALIFNSPEIQINNRDEFVTSFSTVSQEIATTNNQNKILLNYGFGNEAEFVRYFSSKSTVFADNFFRDLFVEGEEINKSNVFNVPFPMQDECRNLLNYCRFKNTKTVEWNEYENIVEMLVAENKTLKQNENQLVKVSELSMEELVKNNVIKSKTISLDIEEVRPILNKIKGQQDNIEIITKKIKIWAKSKNRKKPATFFMVGSSGTGKTFTVETFANAMESSGFSYIYLDMSQYDTKEKANNLIGSPLGFVGSGHTTNLFKAIKENRRLVICFDEIEKADASILKLLMQFVDKGELSNNNYTGDFKECIVFFTSNLAQNEVIEQKNNLLQSSQNKNTIQLLTDTSFKQQIRETLQHTSKNIPTEVWGRFTDILIYNRLQEKDIIEIAIDNIREKTKDNNIIINNISPEYLAYLAKKHANSQFGMRDLVEEINQRIGELNYE